MKKKRLPSALFFCLVLLGINIPTHLFGQWEKELVGFGAGGSIASDTSGNIHLCCLSEPYEGDLVYASRQEDEWIKDTLVRSGIVTQCEAVADKDNILHVAYVEADWHTNVFTLKYMVNGGTGWSTPETVASTEWGITALSLDVDGQGYQHLGYIQTNNIGSSGPLIYLHNRSGTWQEEVVSVLYEEYAYSDASMAVDDEGHAHFAFYNMPGGPAYQTNAPNGEWSEVLSIQDNWSGGQMERMVIDIAVDSEGIPHISYVGSDDGESLENHRYATKAGAGWISEQVDEGDWFSGGHAIAVDSTENSHIAYYHLTSDELRYAMNATGSWTHEILDACESERSVDITVDSDGYAHICYQQDPEHIWYATNHVEVPAPHITLSPEHLSFGTIDTGEVAIDSVYIKNYGMLDLHISDIQISGGDSAEFSIDHSCETIAPGDSCKVRVTFAPKIMGEKQTTLTIESDDPDTPVITAAITGRTPYPVIAADPDNLEFESLKVGEIDSLDLIIENNGDAGLVIDSIRIVNDASEAFSYTSSCVTIAQDTSCKMKVVFEPSGSGTHTAELLIYSNDPYNPEVNVPLLGQTSTTPSGEEGFEDVGLALDSISHASVAWGDYDADGDLDLLMTGWTGSNSEYITKIYQNNDGVLEDTEMNLQGVMAGSDKSCGWTDFNNDGLLDFIITGAKDGQPDEYYTMLYKQVEGTFVETDIGMHGVTSGSVDWGDYDHDGDYDLLINGKGSGSEYAGIYINNINTDNDFEYNNYGFEPVWSSVANWSDFDGDGDLDVLSSGLGATKSQYRNDLPGFSNVQSVLNSIQGRTADVGDFDMDGDLDIVMAGDNADTAYTCIFECVPHEGPATWAYSLKSNIQNIKSGTVAWGDYDNDGDPDLIVSGTKTGLEAHTVLYNNHEGSFWPYNQYFPDLGRSAAAWADYDNDGDLDLLLTGWGEDGPVSAIFRNKRARANTPPAAPEALAVEAGMDSVRLTWQPGSDNETAQEGLTYNLRMGTTPGGSEIISPLSLPDGYRQVPKSGNASLDTSYIVYGLQPNTTYYWSVQTVDNCFEGSAFVQEKSFITSAEPQPEVIYVDMDASGNNDGTSWEDAFNNLQDALHIADFGDSVWVAASYYYPDRGAHIERDDRNASFVIPDGVKLYGGFDGTEIALEERDWENNETFLTGNIGKEKDHSDNARHVVRLINTGDQTLLDGFIIIHGNSEKEDGQVGTRWPDQNPDLFGAGIFIETTEWNSVSNPKIHHCIIKNNKAYMGAGLCIWSCYLSVNKPELLNCKIQGNKAIDGGGLYIVSDGTSCPVLVNCLISGNEAEYSGGGIDFFTSTNNAQTEENTILKNCTFTGNSAEWGGAVRMTNMGPVFVNSLLWNNLADDSGNEVHLHDATPTFTHCDIQGGAEAFGRGGSNSIVYHEILDEDPLFVTAINPEDAPTLEGDFHIEEISPCINAGLNDSVTVAVDLDGEPRIKNDTVDIGVYETEKPEDVPDKISRVERKGLTVYPNPTNGLLKIELGEDSQVEMLKVTTITGAEVISMNVTGQTLLLDLSSCPDGVYLIRAMGGKYISIARIVKH